MAEIQSKKKEYSFLDELPLFITEKLLEFQKSAIQFALNANGRVFIADDMGLGKTLQALSISFIYRKEWPLLIICPSSIVVQWKNQILEWLHPVLLNSDIRIIKRQNEIILNETIHILSYSKAHYTSNIKYKVVVVDESHFIKNSDTKRFRSVLKILSGATRIILLSATPISNSSFSDLLTQYKVFTLANENLVTNNEKKPNNFIQRFKSGANLDISNIKKCRYLLSVDTSADKVSYFKRIKCFANSFKWEIEISKQKAADFVHQYKSWLVGQGKIIFFYKHKEVYKKFLTELQNVDKTRKTIVINGKTRPFERANLLQYFIESKELLFLILQIQVGSTGLDLHLIDKVCFLELDYNPTTLLQAEDRIHRIGQKNECSIYYVATKDPYLVDSTRFLPSITKKLTFMAKFKFTDDCNLKLATTLLNKV